MKQNRQLVQLPNINTNVANILSEIRDYIKVRNNLRSITSKNVQSKDKDKSLLVNHSSLNHIKYIPQQQKLMQRYKKIRQIQAPYRQIIAIQKKVIDQIEKLNPLNECQRPAQQNQMKSRYFKKNSKHSKSIDNTKHSKAIISIIKNKKEGKNFERLCYCLNLIPQKSSISNKSTTRSPQRTQKGQKRQKSLDKKSKARSFLRQMKNARKQSIKGFRYEPWQNKEEQHDFVLY